MLSRHQSTVNSTLLLACEQGDAKLVAWAIRNCGDITIRDSYSSATPLIKAVLGNHINVIIVIMILCRLRVNDFVYLQDSQGLNAFHWALYRGNIKCVSVLLYLEPTIFSKTDGHGRTCAQIVKIKSNQELVCFLQHHCPQLLGTMRQYQSHDARPSLHISVSSESSLGARRRLHAKEEYSDIEGNNLFSEASVRNIQGSWSTYASACMRSTTLGATLIWQEFIQEVFRLIKAPRSDHILILPFIICVGSMAIASALSLLLSVLSLLDSSNHATMHEPSPVNTTTLPLVQRLDAMTPIPTALTRLAMSTTPADAPTMSWFCQMSTPDNVIIVGIVVCIAVVSQAGAWVSLYHILNSTRQLISSSITSMCHVKNRKDEELHDTSNKEQSAHATDTSLWMHRLPQECYDRYGEGLYDVAVYYGVPRAVCVVYSAAANKELELQQQLSNATRHDSYHPSGDSYCYGRSGSEDGCVDAGYGDIYSGVDENDSNCLDGSDHCKSDGRLSDMMTEQREHTPASIIARVRPTNTPVVVPTPSTRVTAANESGRCPIEICHICQARLPLRAGHCKEVGTCVLGFDHYCQFLRGCICTLNYHFFILYLFSMMCAESVFLLQGIDYMKGHTDICIHDETLSSATEQYQHINQSSRHTIFPRFLLMFLMWTIFLGVMTSVMVGYHMVLIHRGRTTKEDIYRPRYLSSPGVRSPFDKGGLIANMRQVIKQGILVYNATSTSKSNGLGYTQQPFVSNKHALLDDYSSSSGKCYFGTPLLFRQPQENMTL
jgi:ribosomal protein L40E